MSFNQVFRQHVKTSTVQRCAFLIITC